MDEMSAISPVLLSFHLQDAVRMHHREAKGIERKFEIWQKDEISVVRFRCPFIISGYKAFTR